jgi:hypothetical protein
MIGCTWRGGAWQENARPSTVGTVRIDGGVFEKGKNTPSDFKAPVSEKLWALFDLNGNTSEVTF